jgi:Family of unknown function (DUF5681)
MAQDESTGTPPSGAAEYAVGYGKPPLHTRFRKGISGNPRGRPRRKTDLASLLTEALDRRNASERRKPRTQREAVVAALVEKSAAGDLPATKLVFELIRQIGPAAELPASPEDDPREILLQRLARLAANRGEPTPE